MVFLGSIEIGFVMVVLLTVEMRSCVLKEASCKNAKKSLKSLNMPYIFSKFPDSDLVYFAQNG